MWTGLSLFYHPANYCSEKVIECYIFNWFKGCLAPIDIIIPEGSMINPHDDAAVVGGNVLTSQRLVDVIFKAFETCAASQVIILFKSALVK